MAELTGISHGTLGNWSKDERWQARAHAEDWEDAKSIRATLAPIILGEAIKSLLTVVDLRDDPATPAKVRFDAAAWLAEIAGVVPAPRGTLLEPPAVPDEDAPNLDNLTPEERLRMHRDLLAKWRGRTKAG